MTDPITILDGGTGRELKRIGAPFRQPEWSALALIEAPEYVTRAHENFIRAGANIITSNSYAVVPFHIGEERFASDGLRLVDLAGKLARQAADAAPHSVKVAGSLPPVFGSYRADLFDASRVQSILSVLVQGLRPYVDHWQAETLSSIAEAQAVRTAIGNDGKPLWISFTLDDEAADPSMPRLRSGEAVADAVRAVAGLDAAAILFNCSQPEVMAAAVDTAHQTLLEIGANLQIGVYANAFPPQRKDAEANADLDEIRADLTAPGYLAFARDWVARGASIVGGCCGIGPEHIQALSVALKP
ncbi:MAG: homocysteine S-methyltransferase [Proteobacteria bacterium]|nr:homocysteine S-methyltransferase [Pseudomonadota bacterium]